MLYVHISESTHAERWKVIQILLWVFFRPFVPHEKSIEPFSGSLSFVEKRKTKKHFRFVVPTHMQHTPFIHKNSKYMLRIHKYNICLYFLVTPQMPPLRMWNANELQILVFYLVSYPFWYCTRSPSEWKKENEIALAAINILTLLQQQYNNIEHWEIIKSK